MRDEQAYIVFDSTAFIEADRAEVIGEGVRLLDEAYLLENNVCPWQLKTVRFIGNLALTVSGLGASLFGGLAVWSGRSLGGAG